jgi:hypothetical protein
MSIPCFMFIPSFTDHAVDEENRRNRRREELS